MTGEMSDEPFAQKKFVEVKGRRMAYIDEGEGDAIVFQHGNPTSSYLWRNVMPHLRGMGRLVACDLIGMGDSAKLPPAGPDRYHYEEQRDYLFALWDALGLASGSCWSCMIGGRPLASSGPGKTTAACKGSLTWRRSSRRCFGPTIRKAPGAAPSRTSDHRRVTRRC